MPTALSAVQICNLALARIQVLTPITSLSPPNNTPAGLACANSYDFVRQLLLHEFPWGWASKYQQLTLVANFPNEEWAYAYQYPTDCLFVRRLMITPTTTVPPIGSRVSPTFDRSDINLQPVPFEIGYLNNSQVIFTDLQNATAKYTFDQQDTSPFVPEFLDIFVWRLAVELSLSLAASDGIKRMVMQEYERAVRAGASHALNESQNSKPFTPGNSEFISGRWNQ